MYPIHVYRKKRRTPPKKHRGKQRASLPTPRYCANNGRAKGSTRYTKTPCNRRCTSTRYTTAPCNRRYTSTRCTKTPCTEVPFVHTNALSLVCPSFYLPICLASAVSPLSPSLALSLPLSLFNVSFAIYLDLICPFLSLPLSPTFLSQQYLASLSLFSLSPSLPRSLSFSLSPAQRRHRGRCRRPSSRSRPRR